MLDDLEHRARTGDASAIQDLFGRLRRYAVGTLVRIHGDHALAEDAAQETLIRLLAVLRGPIPERSNLRGLAVTIAQRVMIDLLRRETRHAWHPQDPRRPTGDSPLRDKKKRAALRAELLARIASNNKPQGE
jgi:DNA-directed RNA polymerase specialized sigma24 family protein